MTDPTVAKRIADEVTTKAASSHMNWHEQRQLMVARITTAFAEARRKGKRKGWEEAVTLLDDIARFPKALNTEQTSEVVLHLVKEFRRRSRAQEGKC